MISCTNRKGEVIVALHHMLSDTCTYLVAAYDKWVDLLLRLENVSIGNVETQKVACTNHTKQATVIHCCCVQGMCWGFWDTEGLFVFLVPCPKGSQQPYLQHGWK